MIMDSKKITIEDLRPGMIGLAGGDMWIQKGIKYFTSSDWSHSFTIMDKDNVLSILETTSTYVHCIPVTEKLKEPDYMAIWEPVCNEQDAAIAATSGYIKYNGMLYGYESYLWYIYRWVVRKLFKKEPNKMWSIVNNRVTCTELTCSILANSSSALNGLFPNDLNTYAPEELYEVILRNPQMFKWVGWLQLPKDKELMN